MAWHRTLTRIVRAVCLPSWSTSQLQFPQPYSHPEQATAEERGLARCRLDKLGDEGFCLQESKQQNETTTVLVSCPRGPKRETFHGTREENQTAPTPRANSDSRRANVVHTVSLTTHLSTTERLSISHTEWPPQPFYLTGRFLHFSPTTTAGKRRTDNWRNQRPNQLASHSGGSSAARARKVRRVAGAEGRGRVGDAGRVGGASKNLSPLMR
ncbi:hypothetical protein AOLI_G00292570 [Acnodon oligacanthus]